MISFVRITQHTVHRFVRSMTVIHRRSFGHVETDGGLKSDDALI